MPIELNKISADLDVLEQEIASAEKDLSVDRVRRELLQKQGLQYGVKDTEEAIAKIAEHKSKLEKNEKKIVDGYSSLKSEYEWS